MLDWTESQQDVSRLCREVGRPDVRVSDGEAPVRPLGEALGERVGEPDELGGRRSGMRPCGSLCCQPVFWRLGVGVGLREGDERYLRAARSSRSSISVARRSSCAPPPSAASCLASKSRTHKPAAQASRISEVSHSRPARSW